MLGTNNCWVKKMFVWKKILTQKFGSNKIFGPKKVWQKKSFWKNPPFWPLRNIKILKSGPTLSHVAQHFLCTLSQYYQNKEVWILLHINLNKNELVSDTFKYCLFMWSLPKMTPITNYIPLFFLLQTTILTKKKGGFQKTNDILKLNEPRPF